MLHMQFLQLAMALVEKSCDGNLTLEEVVDCVEKSFPEYCVDIHDAISEAMEDGYISVWDTIKILIAVIA